MRRQWPGEKQILKFASESSKWPMWRLILSSFPLALLDFLTMCSFFNIQPMSLGFQQSMTPPGIFLMLSPRKFSPWPSSDLDSLNTSSSHLPTSSSLTLGLFLTNSQWLFWMHWLLETIIFPLCSPVEWDKFFILPKSLEIGKGKLTVETPVPQEKTFHYHFLSLFYPPKLSPLKNQTGSLYKNHFVVFNINKIFYNYP